jgi:hypothetical protein
MFKCCLCDATVWPRKASSEISLIPGYMSKPGKSKAGHGQNRLKPGQSKPGQLGLGLVVRVGLGG